MKFLALLGLSVGICFILAVVVGVGVYSGLDCFFKNKFTIRTVDPEETKEIE